eukprot:763011-Hanusia_phi.AAC.3
MQGSLTRGREIEAEQINQCQVARGIKETDRGDAQDGTCKPLVEKFVVLKSGQDAKIAGYACINEYLLHGDTRCSESTSISCAKMTKERYRFHNHQSPH